MEAPRGLCKGKYSVDVGLGLPVKKKVDRKSVV